MTLEMPPNGERMSAIPFVPALTTCEVALPMDVTKPMSKSDIPLNVSLIPVPTDCIIWLPPEARADIVSPNTFPIPTIKFPDPCSRKSISSSKFRWLLFKISSKVVLGGAFCS